jgi:hypothetical protein
MTKTTKKASPKPHVDPEAERAAIKEKGLKMGVVVSMTAGNATRTGKITAIDMPEKVGASPIVTYVGSNVKGEEKASVFLWFWLCVLSGARGLTSLAHISRAHIHLHPSIIIFFFLH